MSDAELTRWMSYGAAWLGGWALGIVFGMWIGERKFRAFTHLKARIQAMREVPDLAELPAVLGDKPVTEWVDQRTIELAGRAIVERKK